VCESGCITREGVRCVVRCKHVCVAVSWTKLFVQVRQTFSLFTMNNLLLEQTRVCLISPKCLGLRPFIVAHFNAIVSSFCDWLWRAVVVHLPVLSLYWEDYCQLSCCVFQQVKLFTSFSFTRTVLYY